MIVKKCAITVKLQVKANDTITVQQLIVLVRYVHDGSIRENYIFCEELNTTTKTKDLFELVKDAFAKHQLDIQSIGSVYIDGTPAMLGKTWIFYTEKTLDSTQVTHCFLHWHALVSKTSSLKLKKVLHISGKTNDWIRGNALNHFFKSP